MTKRDMRATARHTLFIDTNDAAFWLAATSFVDEEANKSPTYAYTRRGDSRLSSRQVNDAASRFAAANSVRRRPLALHSATPPPALPHNCFDSLPVVKPLNVRSSERPVVHLASPVAIGPSRDSMFAAPRPAPPTPDVVARSGVSPLSPVSPLPPPVRKVGSEPAALLPAVNLRQEHLETPTSPCPSSDAPSSLLQLSPRVDGSHMSTQTSSSAGLHHIGATIASAFPSPPQREQKAAAVQLVDYNAARKLALEEQNRNRRIALCAEKDGLLRLATKPLPPPPSNDEDDEDAPEQTRFPLRQVAASSSLDIARLVRRQVSNDDFTSARANALRPQHSFDALRQARSANPPSVPVHLPATPPPRSLISTVRSHDRGQRSGSPAQKHSPMGSTSSASQLSYLSDTSPSRVNPDDWELPWQQVRSYGTTRHQRQASSKSSTSSSGGSTFTSSGTSSSSRATNSAECQTTTPPWERTQLSKGSASSTMVTIHERKQLAAHKESPHRSPLPRKVSKHNATAYFASAVDPFPLSVQVTNQQSRGTTNGVPSSKLMASSDTHLICQSGRFSPAARTAPDGNASYQGAFPVPPVDQSAHARRLHRAGGGDGSIQDVDAHKAEEIEAVGLAL